MSHKSILQVSALALGLIASNVIVFADAASAQDRPSHERGNRNGGTKPTTTPRVVTPTPAPRVVTPAPRVVQPQVARPAPSHWYNRGPRHVSPPPVVRHAAPAPQHHRGHEQRRGWGWGWRPWAYGAAVTGAVIVGSRYASASRSSVQVCADRYESFDWDTGTIENEYGERELCPYLE